MQTAAIIVPQDNIFFSDLAKALVMSFMELGWNVMWLGDKDQIREYARQIDLAVVLSPFDYKDIRKILPRTTKVLYQLEALPWPQCVHLKRRKYWKWEERLEAMNSYDAVWEADLANIKEHYRYYNIRRPLIHMPVGYSSIFELDKRVSQRNIALFIGEDGNHPRVKPRRRIVRRVQSLIPKQFKIVKGRYGDKAKQSAKNARINLNIHQNRMQNLESLRVVGLLMSNKCFVMTEPVLHSPFENNKHWVVVEGKDMAAEIKYYLEMATWEVDRIAKEGYNFVKNHYTMTQHLKKALEQL